MYSTLAISRTLLDEMLASADASDKEVCGLLLSVGNDRRTSPVSVMPDLSPACRVSSIQPCTNIHATPATHFELDPAPLLAAHRAARVGGAQIVGHYHSHPSGDARPSATDAASARPDGAFWIIVAGGEARAWRAVRDGAVHGRFNPVELVTTPPCT